MDIPSMDVRPVSLIELTWPEYGPAAAFPQIDAAELRLRLERTRAAMRARGFSHLVVYGDREHFANLAWLCHLDPRFEEALLILRPDRDPLLLVGNECQSYLPISPLFREGMLRTERYQPFSLLDQPRDESRSLDDIFREEGISKTSMVGCVGFKSYGDPLLLDLPAYLADALRRIAGREQVLSATELLMHAGEGLRAQCSAWEIAFFEASNGKASEAMRRILWAVREGVSDFELLQEARYDGTPLSCAMTCKTGPNRISLASPRGGRGDARLPLVGERRLLGQQRVPCRLGGRE
jgi:Xaa-Pro aminopeptidase